MGNNKNKSKNLIGNFIITISIQIFGYFNKHNVISNKKKIKDLKWHTN